MNKLSVLVHLEKYFFFLVLILSAHFLLLIYTLQGLTHFDEILQEADGIILARGNLGVDLPPEKVNFHI